MNVELSPVGIWMCLDAYSLCFGHNTSIQKVVSAMRKSVGSNSGK